MKNYEIVMKTPLGNKCGLLSVCIEGNKLNGFIRILKSSNPISGTIDKLGNCKVLGSIDTNVEKLQFSAIGIISTNSLELVLDTGQRQYKVSGSAKKGGDI